MLSGLPLSIMLAGVFLAFYVMDFYFMARFDPQRQEGRKGWSWDYTLLTIAMAAVVLLQPVLWPGIGWYGGGAAGIAVQVAGGLAVLASFGLHIWSRNHLRQFYVERVEVQAGHKLVDTGPYGLVRHPLITSFFLLAGGVFLLNPAITTALILLYTFWDFTRSAKQEEELLSRTVQGYQAYMERTPAFWPRLWRAQ